MILSEIKVHTYIREATNCYIIQDTKTKETMVIDPGSEADKIINILNELDSNLKYIYLTHCHGDHIGAVNEIKKEKGGLILIHKDDVTGLNDPNINLTSYVLDTIVEIDPDVELNDGDTIYLGNIEFKVIHTPGHTMGGSSLYCKEENILFTGDTLFKSTMGRTDLPTSSYSDIIDSIKNKLLVLPEETLVYPGHGRSTSIKDEIDKYIKKG